MTANSDVQDYPQLDIQMEAVLGLQRTLTQKKETRGGGGGERGEGKEGRRKRGKRGGEGGEGTGGEGKGRKNNHKD